MRLRSLALVCFFVQRAAPLLHLQSRGASARAGFFRHRPGSSPPSCLHMKRKAPGPSPDEEEDPFKSFRYEGQADLAPSTPTKADPRHPPPQGVSAISSPAPSTPPAAPSPAAAGPARLIEKYHSPGHPERPLRLLLVGHNPSDHAWKSGHYYSNPSNRMWRLLTSTGIVLPHFTAQNDDDCPHLCGVGFTDLGTGTPGTKSSAFSNNVLRSWRHSLYHRLQAHAARAGAPPRVIAFTGKRQFKELLFDHPDFKASKKADVSYGLQDVRPLGWPFGKEEVVVFVLTSSSGASALKNEVREAPYRELAKILEGFGPWVVQEEGGLQAGKSEGQP